MAFGKRHEQHVGPTLAAALQHFSTCKPQGECTVVLGGAPASKPEAWDADALRAQLQQLRAEGLSASDSARELASRSGHSRRELYALLHSAAD